MSDWHSKTLPLAQRALEIRSRLAKGAVARARAHLEICDALEAAVTVQNEALSVMTGARIDGRSDFIEASMRTWELASQVSNEASDLVAMMRVPA